MEDPYEGRSPSKPGVVRKSLWFSSIHGSIYCVYLNELFFLGQVLLWMLVSGWHEPLTFNNEHALSDFVTNTALCTLLDQNESDGQ